MNSSLEPTRTVVFALCGSFCTFETVLPQIIRLRACGWEVLPMLSYAASALDTRFGARQIGSSAWRKPPATARWRICGKRNRLAPSIWHRHLSLLPVPAQRWRCWRRASVQRRSRWRPKSMLRGGRPVVIGVSTNDGLSGSVGALAALLQRKNYYFIPFGQDDSYKKPCSLKADFTQLPDTLEAALRGVQLQPILL